jgi:hypothetical protein
VVLPAGETTVLPLGPKVPTAGSMVTEVAFVTLQVSVAEPPRVMLVGLALK